MEWNDNNLWLPPKQLDKCVDMAKKQLLATARPVIQSIISADHEQRFLQKVTERDMEIGLCGSFTDLAEDIHAYVYFSKGRPAIITKDYVSDFRQIIAIHHPASDDIIKLADPMDIPILAADMVRRYIRKLRAWIRSIDETAEEIPDGLIEENILRIKTCYEQILTGQFGMS